LIGDVWECTSSDFLPYPGLRAFLYKEYSEVFFGAGHKVLRGGSFAVDAVACRSTFRNWDLPVRRQCPGDRFGGPGTVPSRPTALTAEYGQGSG
jgi:formylglycine-generating enzyme required for sulfatase activity